MVQDDSKHNLIQPNALHQYSVTAADFAPVMSDARHVPVELAPQGISGHRSRRLGKVLLLRRRIHLVRTPHEVIQPGQ